MGLYDRDYTRESAEAGYRYVPQMRMSFPVLTPAVKFLLITNIGVFLVGVIFQPLQNFLYGWFQLDATSFVRAIQLWRVITYQFLHASFMHIFMNMLGLYFLGPTLEKYWGTRKFLPFYLGCGAAGALFYVLLVAVNFLPPGQMIGASGAILGLLAACAILFPNFVIFIYFFPLPIRVAALGLIIWYLVAIISKGINAGGNAAHLAGMAAGAAYVWLQPFRSQLKMKIRASRWQKQMDEHHKLQSEVDRILQKVHDSGLHSLSRKEKRTLKKATKIEQLRRGSY
jgi:membrane associated rhomboid family serine protease